MRLLLMAVRPLTSLADLSAMIPTRPTATYTAKFHTSSVLMHIAADSTVAQDRQLLCWSALICTGLGTHHMHAMPSRLIGQLYTLANLPQHVQHPILLKLWLFQTATCRAGG